VTTAAVAGKPQENEEEVVSLQARFEAFRAKRKAELKHAREIKAQQAKKAAGRSQEEKDTLRARFLEQALKYKGIPYHRRYHPDPEGKHKRKKKYQNALSRCVVLFSDHSGLLLLL